MESTTMESLKHEFSEDEKREIGKQMAASAKEWQDAEAEKKTVDTRLKEKIDGIKAQLHSSAQKIRDGYEYRQAECIIRPNYKMRTIEVYRKDNGAFVRSRDMNKEEIAMLQMRLDQGYEDLGAPSTDGAASEADKIAARKTREEAEWRAKPKLVKHNDKVVEA